MSEAIDDKVATLLGNNLHGGKWGEYLVSRDHKDASFTLTVMR